MQIAVHPHACGECSASRRERFLTAGSPPRLWGMQYYVWSLRERARFTPTPVGNAHALELGMKNVAVHPHACGECVVRLRLGAAAGGSPPRLWGMPRPAHRRPKQVRFTPTPVGNAEVRYNSTCNLTVHPHACGECDAQTSGINKAGGSPPRLWGMQRMAPSRFRGWRFTPTPVGNAASLVIAPHLASVHPHACGECTAKRLGREPQGGSPPRLWGMLETCQVLH